MLPGPPAIGALAELFGPRAAFGSLAPLPVLAFVLAPHVNIERPSADP